MRKLYLIHILLLFMFILPILSCSSSNKEAQALEYAQEWVGNNTTALSNDIATIIANHFPETSSASTKIANCIAQLASWSYPTTNKLGSNKYEVIAHCSSLIGVTSIGNYVTSVDIHLTVDTNKKTLASWFIDENSLIFVAL